MAAAGPLIILGSQGNIGRRLMAAFPGAIGIDRLPGATIVGQVRAALGD
jgi:hypothetical protein